MKPTDLPAKTCVEFELKAYNYIVYNAKYIGNLNLEMYAFSYGINLSLNICCILNLCSELAELL